MLELSPGYFFELENYEHAKLFEGCEYVWEVLGRIKGHLQAAELGRIEVEVPREAYLVDRHLISIREGTVIEPGAYIKGPCIIGKHCTIRHGAYVRGNVITGDYCVIGHDTEAKNTIFLDYAQAAHFAYVGDSVLGNYVNLGAGTKCANLKLNHQNIAIFFQGQQIDSGLKKFGAIIGDHSNLGCNSVPNPGTLIGQRVLCYPCTSFGGVIPSGHLIRTTAPLEIIPWRLDSRKTK